VLDETDEIPNSDEMFLRIINIMLGGDRILKVITERRKRFSSTQRGAIYLALSRARKKEITESRLRETLGMLSEDRVNFVVKWCAGEFSPIEVPIYQ
jgi:hypothetical protein